MNHRLLFGLICCVSLLLSILITMRAVSAGRCQEAILDLLGEELSLKKRESRGRSLNHYLSRGLIKLSSCDFFGEATLRWSPKPLEPTSEILYFRTSLSRPSVWRLDSEPRSWRPLQNLTLLQLSSE